MNATNESSLFLSEFCPKGQSAINFIVQCVLQDLVLDLKSTAYFTRISISRYSDPTALLRQKLFKLCTSRRFPVVESAKKPFRLEKQAQELIGLLRTIFCMESLLRQLVFASQVKFRNLLPSFCFFFFFLLSHFYWSVVHSSTSICAASKCRHLWNIHFLCSIPLRVFTELPFIFSFKCKEDPRSKFHKNPPNFVTLLIHLSD